MLNNYEEYRKASGDLEVNSGLVRKCHEAKFKAVSTEFEGVVVKSMALPIGLAKKKLLQDAFKLLTLHSVPVDEWVLPQLVEYAKESSKGKQSAKGSTAADGDLGTSTAASSAAAAPAPLTNVSGGGSAAPAPSRRRRAA